MKKAMRKFVSVCLSLMLLLSIIPMDAFAVDSTHEHIFGASGTQIICESIGNKQHRYAQYSIRTCACGEVEMEEDAVLYTENHAPQVGSGQCLGSYRTDDGTTITTYQYTCAHCLGIYTADVVEKPE